MTKLYLLYENSWNAWLKIVPLINWTVLRFHKRMFLGNYPLLKRTWKLKKKLFYIVLSSPHSFYSNSMCQNKVSRYVYSFKSDLEKIQDLTTMGLNYQILSSTRHLRRILDSLNINFNKLAEERNKRCPFRKGYKKMTRIYRAWNWQEILLRVIFIN